MVTKKIVIVIVILLATARFYVNASRPVEIIQNSLEEIEACKGKLKLDLIRIWGGEKEEDEKKFFRMPYDLKIDEIHNVYISDMNDHCIKIYNQSGKFLRSIGRKGRGPGDLYTPAKMALLHRGGLIVYEIGGRRLQHFDLDGNSKHIIKYTDILHLVGATSKDELVAYDHHRTIKSGKLAFLLTVKGETIREVGTYHDKSKNYLESEKLIFAIDEDDNIYAGHTAAPVIRIYSPIGNLLKVITIATPYEAPYSISMNPKGNEINKVDTVRSRPKTKIKGTIGGGVIIQNSLKNKLHVKRVQDSIKTDSEKRIYVLIKSRIPTLSEMMSSGVIMSTNGIDRSTADLDAVEKSDLYRILVLKPNGKVFAEADLTTRCDAIYIHNDRLFVQDSINLRFLEYKMSFKE